MAQSPLLDQWAPGYAYAHQGTYTLTATASLAVKASAGILHSVNINQKATNSGALVTVYDNTAASGTVIGVIDTSTAVGQIKFDVSAATGITIGMASSSTGVGPDMTFCFQ